MNALACRSGDRPKLGEGRVELTVGPGSVGSARILPNTDDPRNAGRFPSALEGEDRRAAVPRVRPAGQRA